MKRILIIIGVIVFTIGMIWIIYKLMSLQFFLGMLVGFVLTVFLSIFTLKYIEIEDRKRKMANVKPIYQDNYSKSGSGNNIHEGSDSTGSEQKDD